MKPSQYAAYHLWAHRRLAEAVLKLPPEDWTREVIPPFGSLQALYLHLWDAESIWWQRLRLVENVVVPSREFSGGLPEACAGLLRTAEDWQKFVEGALPRQLEHELIYRDSKRQAYKQPVYELLMQVFNHGAYHRGQIASALRLLGVKTVPGTDYVLFCRKK